MKLEQQQLINTNNAWPEEDRRDIGIKFFLFLFSPFISFIYSLRRMNTRSSYVVFFLFFVFFGLSFTVDNDPYNTRSLDGTTYRMYFEQYQNTSAQEFWDGFKTYLSRDNDKYRDYAFFSLAFLVSRFTSNYHFLFLALAAVFAYFKLKTLRYFTTADNYKNTFFFLILVFLFSYNQIFNINGCRFWIAALIAVYSVFKIFKDKRNGYYLLALLTPFIHESYWVFLAILMIATFFRKAEKLWILLFAFSFVFSVFVADIIQGLVAYLPPMLARMAEAYTAETEAIQSGSGAIFFSISRIIIRFYINILVVLLIISGNKSDTINDRQLYLFLLVWMTIVNSFMFVPSLGARYIILGYPLIAYLWLVNFGNTKHKILIQIMPFVFLLDIYAKIVQYSMVVELSFFFSSPFRLVYKYLLV